MLTNDPFESTVHDDDEDITPTVVGVETTPFPSILDQKQPSSSSEAMVMDDSVGMVENPQVALSQLASLYNR